MKQTNSRIRALAAQVDALEHYADDTAEVLRVPDIVEFVLSPEFLDQPHAYPRQLLLLKLAALQLHLLTEDDHAVLAEWADGFQLEAGQADGEARYVGEHGLPPDVLERAKQLREQGCRWFNELVFVLGRRAGKTYLSAALAVYLLWHLLALDDPHAEFGIPPGKVITVVVLAGNFSQAKSTQFADIVQLLTSSPAFAPFIDEQRVSSIRLKTPADIAAGRKRGSIEIVAKEATPLSVRGAPIIALLIDEAAHVEPGTAGVSADELYTAGSPATDQFGPWSLIVLSSSPATQTGRFYRQHRAALDVDPDTGIAKNPAMFTAQLTSWDTYIDYDIAHTLPVVPDDVASEVEFHRDPVTGKAKYYPPIARAIQTYDDRMRRLEENDPVSFSVERRAHWAQVSNPFLNPVHVDRMFNDWQGRKLLQQSSGQLNLYYVAHGDPASTEDNFGWIIAHREGPDEQGRHHVVVDRIRYWHPPDYPDHTIDYPAVEDEMWEDIAAFGIEHVTFDTHNSVQLTQGLRKRALGARLPTRATITTIAHTNGRNMVIAENLRSALTLGLVHAPNHTLLEQELKFLTVTPTRVDHPKSGPVTTDDLAMCLMVVVQALIGDRGIGIFEALGSEPLRAANPTDQGVFDQLGSLRRDRKGGAGTDPSRGRRGFRP